MKRRYILLIVFLVPVVTFLNVWQVYRYKRLESAIQQLESDQKEWVEKNKRLIAGIAVLRSPKRLEKIVTEDLGLNRIEAGRLIKILLPDGKAKDEDN